MRSGGVWFDNGTIGGPHLGGQGISGMYWSSFAYSNPGGAYGFHIDDNIIRLYATNAYYARSLRCLSTVLDI